MPDKSSKIEKLLNRIIIDSFCIQNFCKNDELLSTEFINICVLSQRINNKAKLLKKYLSI